VQAVLELAAETDELRALFVRERRGNRGDQAEVAGQDLLEQFAAGGRTLDAHRATVRRVNGTADIVVPLERVEQTRHRGAGDAGQVGEFRGLAGDTFIDAKKQHHSETTGRNAMLGKVMGLHIRHGFPGPQRS